MARSRGLGDVYKRQEFLLSNKTVDKDAAQDAGQDAGQDVSQDVSQDAAQTDNNQDFSS
jgi:hypothetical protein